MKTVLIAPTLLGNEDGASRFLKKLKIAAEAQQLSQRVGLIVEPSAGKGGDLFHESGKPGCSLRKDDLTSFDPTGLRVEPDLF